MNEQEWLADRFEEHRAHLRAVAYRMLGSLAEADDAVQDTWLRLSRSGASEVENLGGWLTTIVARVCRWCDPHWSTAQPEWSSPSVDDHSP
jgi:RNA polymerase sigma-70 factor (ECF subfamily)